jgi:hypothetical protein
MTAALRDSLVVLAGESADLRDGALYKIGRGLLLHLAAERADAHLDEIVALVRERNGLLDGSIDLDQVLDPGDRTPRHEVIDHVTAELDFALGFTLARHPAATR